MTSHTLVGGQVLSNTHAEGQCLGEYCTIHNPSNHWMSKWIQQFVGGKMYRVSTLGDVYPDPDEPNPPPSPNAIRCLRCDTVLISLHRHDYRTCACENACMVDGGYEYSRRGWKNGAPEDCFVEIEEWPVRWEWF